MKLPIKDKIVSAFVLCLCIAIYTIHKMDGGGFVADLSFMAIFLMLLNRTIPSPDLTGMEFSFFSYRHDNLLRNIFPLKGTVIKYVTLSGEDDWMLVKLKEAFQHQNMTIAYVLIKRNDKQAIVPNKLNQLVFFKMVPDVSMICEKENDKTAYPHEVWALCR